MILFVAGIDTGIGKTIATGLLAAWFRRQRRSTITQKLVQTGCEGESEDIRAHRELMGVDLLPDDIQRVTCPAIYPFPGSPHLAAALAGQSVDVKRIIDCARQLAARYEIVVIEGAGGLMVPLTRDTTLIELVARQAWPVVLVTAPRLGSINHTLLSLEAMRSRGMELAAVLYNLHYFAEPEIVTDTRTIIQEAIARMQCDAPVIDLPSHESRGEVGTWDNAGLQSLLRYM